MIERLGLSETDFAVTQPTEAEKTISALKARLAKTDYQAIKYAEGWLTDEEYAPIKAQRQVWRDEINRLAALADESTPDKETNSPAMADTEQGTEEGCTE